LMNKTSSKSKNGSLHFCSSSDRRSLNAKTSDARSCIGSVAGLCLYPWRPNHRCHREHGHYYGRSLCAFLSKKPGFSHQIHPVKGEKRDRSISKKILSGSLVVEQGDSQRLRRSTCSHR
jgi:hypothetical protein